MFFGQQSQDREPQPKQEEGPSLYQIIGLGKQATTHQITKHFRRRAVKQHPDKGGDPEKYRQLSEAYEILKDPEKRDLYEKYGMEGVKAGGDPKGGDIFSFFNQDRQNQGPKKCKPKLVKVDVSLEEVFKGSSKNVSVDRKRVCEKCEGNGGVNSKKCPTCKGQRYQQKLVMVGPGMYTQSMAPCDECHAQGVIFQQKDRCEVCKGERIVDNTKQFQVTIEPGVPDEEDVIFTGEADQIPGALAGDVYFRINIEEDPVFKRKGADLYITKEISLLQSLTGVSFQVTLPDGQIITAASAPNQIISNMQKKIIKHKGMPFYKEPMSRGHLIVTFEVKYPKKQEINDKQYARLATLLGQQATTKVIGEGAVRKLEHYEQVHQQEQAQDHQEQGQQGVQCQSQ